MTTPDTSAMTDEPKTPKQRYDERRRLRAERLLHREQEAERQRRRQDDAEEAVERIMLALERIADAVELWAETQ